MVGLGAGARARVDLGAAALAGGELVAVGADGGGGEAGEGDAQGQGAGRVEHAAGRAARGGEHGDGGGGAAGRAEGVGEVEDAVHVGAPEGVDRLVGVAEGEERAALSGEGFEEADLGGVGVLVLVDVDRVVRLREVLRDVGAAGEEVGAVDEFGVVDDALEVEHVEVLGEERGGGLPVGAAGAAREAVQGGRIEAEFAAAGEHGAYLVGESARREAGAELTGPADPAPALGGEGGLALQEFPHGEVLLGPGEQPDRGAVGPGLLVGADERVAVGVEGRGARGGRGADAQGHAVAQRDGGLAAEGEDEEALGVRARLDAGGDGLDERLGLARAGSGEDEERSGAVLNHGPLVRVQWDGARRGPRGAHQPVAARALPPGPGACGVGGGAGGGAHCGWPVLVGSSGVRRYVSRGGGAKSWGGSAGVRLRTALSPPPRATGLRARRCGGRGPRSRWGGAGCPPRGSGRGRGLRGRGGGCRRLGRRATRAPRRRGGP